MNGVLTVGTATVTVTADAKSKVYGSVNPALTATYSGLANNQTFVSSGITGTVSLTTTADATSGVGTYTITASQGSLASTNYTFSYVNGALSVTPATLSVTANNDTKVYGSTNPALAATITGFVNGEYVS